MKVFAVHTSATLVEASRRVGEAIVVAARDAVGARGRFAIALAGGRTPESLYRQLATDFSAQMPWDKVHIFWSDERFVPADDADSNYGMAKRALLDHVPCPAANVHAMPTGRAAEAAASSYERTLRDFFGDEPRFDVMLLGIGADGHTASLFPHSPAIHELTDWVLATVAPVKPATRLTLTFPVINASRATFVLAAGADKIKVVERARASTADPDTYPAAKLRESSGSVVWSLARMP